MSATLNCYKCGTSLEQLSLPLRRLEECPQCRTELHVCRMCTHYAPSLPKGCDEDDAEEVREKQRANFCDYFRPDPNAYQGGELAAEQHAEAQLRALFGEASDEGESSGPEDPALRRVQELFRK
jgi:hypothetical protein